MIPIKKDLTPRMISAIEDVHHLHNKCIERSLCEDQTLADLLIDDAELEERRAAFAAAGGYRYPASQTPWQEIQGAVVGQLGSGAILEGAEAYQRIAQTRGLPRDNH